MKWILGILILLLFSCQKQTRFELLTPEQTGVDFVNDLRETAQLNILTYLYFYNGGGVAAGDLNGDDLPDLYFTSNLDSNRLYLNLGDFKFKEITKLAGVGGMRGWTSGVTMADVNADGKLDIYVSQVGDYQSIIGRNQLYINLGNDENGIPLFENQAKKFNLDLKSFATQAAFFDYDLDGDLDMYMLNHSVHSQGTFGKSTLRNETHPLSGDKLMRNDDGVFIEVTAESGIYSSVLGYGLGITVGDINMDGFPDIYIGNDFHENDYLYINNGDGSFSERLEEFIQHTSRFSMGNDLGDFNNDGLMDVLSLDMLPDDPEMLKMSTAEDHYDIYNHKLRFGYSHQFARNSLQLNLGNNQFSEIGMLSNIYATDWSWSGLFADLDLDGYKDIFISNGIKRRSNDMDYINYVSNEAIRHRLEGDLTDKELELIQLMPQVKIPNYVFQNTGGLKFEKRTSEWGLNKPSFSNGTVYVDLDDDGDLDLVINNTDDPAFIFKNNTISAESTPNHFLKFRFRGEGQNPFGIGAKVIIPSKKGKMVYELFPTRGWQSSVSPELVVGLGKTEKVDSVLIIWPDLRYEVMKDVSVNQKIEVFQKNAKGKYDFKNQNESIFVDLTPSLKLDYTHRENKFIEFNREKLIPHMVSTEGPMMAVGDIDGDGRDDFFVGGAKRQSGVIFRQVDTGFVKSIPYDLEKDRDSEDIGAAFVDVDNDQDLDLFVVSGGNEFKLKSPQSLPRLYLNNGTGDFTRARDRLPDIHLTGSCVSPGDFDSDGDVDLFLGGRAIPWNYGLAPSSYLLINDGKGFFSDGTDDPMEKQLLEIGFVKDASWNDLNNDGRLDLIIVGEWMPLTIFMNEETGFKKLDPSDYGLGYSNGWWNTITSMDFDQDGDLDFLVGNLGENSKLKASSEEPVCMYVKDFDENGSVDQLLCHFKEGKPQLFATKDEIFSQLVELNKKFVSYKDYAEAELEEVFPESELKTSLKYMAYEFRSGVFVNKGDLKFDFQPFPTEAQFSPIMALHPIDHNQDGLVDILAGGNFYEVNIQRGRYDASYGILLQNNGDSFEHIPNRFSGIKLTGQVRDIKSIIFSGQEFILVAKNNGSIQVIQLDQAENKAF